ncbi:hypothetical protein RclHR1_00300006 [Rhizophagus clarus]|uniref:Uncharacterized protein n=1 Tax=Rhizophagus clarus TaxID=94130 RepID=A0A2Z6R565_9GLOM|nr:hypothetical protein RclHR1_00300006 [Rhizophagus clarus]GES92331.1 hypothetical protein GLOIN_2v1786770 [Rhizophagus clarus]
MNPNYLNYQFSNSENHGPNFNQNTIMEASSRMNISSAQHNNININPSNPQYIMQVNTTSDSQNNLVVDQQKPNHPFTFFYQPPNDPCNYHINCREISINTLIQLLNELNGATTNDDKNEYIFHYQQLFNNRIYQVSCEIVFSLILNKYIYDIEIEQNFVQNLSFTPNQKENLKYYLTQYLSHYLLN